jgi:hypothetical protein
MTVYFNNIKRLLDELFVIKRNIKAGYDNSRCLVVPDWYANGCCRVLALIQTQYSMSTYSH